MLKTVSTALIAAASLFLAGDTSQRSRITETQQYVNQVSAEYGIDAPQISFVREIPGEARQRRGYQAMASMTCRRSTRECRIEILECTLGVHERRYWNLVIHEMAHVINFQINNLGDHGREWKEIMLALGARPYQYYPPGSFPNCG